MSPYDLSASIGQQQNSIGSVTGYFTYCLVRLLLVLLFIITYFLRFFLLLMISIGKPRPYVVEKVEQSGPLYERKQKNKKINLIESKRKSS